MIRRIRVTLTAMVPAVFTAATAMASQPQPAQDGFVPVTGPISEQIPAAPLVVAAYAFFLLLMVFYLWTIWRRIGRSKPTCGRSSAGREPVPEATPSDSWSLHLHPVRPPRRDRDRMDPRIARRPGCVCRGIATA